MTIAAVRSHSPAHLNVAGPRRGQSDRLWTKDALSIIRAEANRQGETNLMKLRLPGLSNVDLYLKDESLHPSGSLKHRLAQSLFTWGLCSGKIGRDTTIIECSSGSTAISEAYFANLLGLKLVAVIPKSTTARKVREIERFGGTCRFVEPDQIHECATVLANEADTYFMDQFLFAERATDWRSDQNIAAAIFRQMSAEAAPNPDWIVVGAGTGGTSTTIGRYIRHAHGASGTKLCVVDPENSALFDYYKTGDPAVRMSHPSRIDGIGRPQPVPSFYPELIDRMIQVPDSASIAAIQFLQKVTGRRFGGSTGTSFFGAYHLALELESRRKKASIVSLICDSGERYSDTYYNQDWLASQSINPDEHSGIFRD